MTKHHGAWQISTFAKQQHWEQSIKAWGPWGSLAWWVSCDITGWGEWLKKSDRRPFRCLSCLSFNVFGPFGHQVLAHLQRSRSANLITYGAVPGLFKSQVTIFGWLSHELFVVAIGCNLYTTHSSARGDPCLRTRSSLEVGNAVGEDLAAEIFGKQCVSTSYSNFHWRVWRRRSFVSYDCVRDFILGQAAQAMTNWASKYISRRACERTSEYEESLVSFWD